MKLVWCLMLLSTEASVFNYGYGTRGTFVEIEETEYQGPESEEESNSRIVEPGETEEEIGPESTFVEPGETEDHEEEEEIGSGSTFVEPEETEDLGPGSNIHAKLPLPGPCRPRDHWKLTPCSPCNTQNLKQQMWVCFPSYNITCCRKYYNLNHSQFDRVYWPCHGPCPPYEQCLMPYKKELCKKNYKLTQECIVIDKKPKDECVREQCQDLTQLVPSCIDLTFCLSDECQEPYSTGTCGPSVKTETCKRVSEAVQSDCGVKGIRPEVCQTEQCLKALDQGCITFEYCLSDQCQKPSNCTTQFVRKTCQDVEKQVADCTKNGDAFEPCGHYSCSSVLEKTECFTMDYCMSQDCANYVDPCVQEEGTARKRALC